MFLLGWSPIGFFIFVSMFLCALFFFKAQKVKSKNEPKSRK